MRALDSHLLEINSSITRQGGNQSATRASSPLVGTSNFTEQSNKRTRDEVEDLLEEMSRGEPEEDDEYRSGTRKRAREDEIPWFNSSSNILHCNSCIETCKTLRRFSKDLSGVKSLLQLANNLPEGIPSTQWDRLLRGESIDLNQILSAMHFVQLDEERKGSLGSAEVVFAIAESKHQIRSGADWSSAFRRASKAVTFLFLHQMEELLEYAEYIEGLFAAKQVNAHPKVIQFDQSVQNQVGGGQNTLLTDYQHFNCLSEAILHANRVEYS